MTGKRFATIYVVEQEPNWRSFALNALRAQGYSVLASSDSRQFLTRTKVKIPSLTILGFSMIGPQELQIIAGFTRRKMAGPVVVVASTLSSQSIRQAFLYGASDVALKSFEERTLLDIINDQQKVLEPQSNYAVARTRSCINE
jgi:DNA-binding NtrC family response regulator